MNSLERFCNTFKFKKTDRMPIFTFGGWRETYLRWEKEGMPKNWKEINFFNEDKICETGVSLGRNGYSPFFPRLEKTILETDEVYEIFRDEHGRVVKRRKDQASKNIAEYLEFPVKDRKDWENFKARMDPTVEVRYKGLEETGKRFKKGDERDFPVIQTLCGTYRIMWHLMGDIHMCYAFYDDPDLVHDIMKHWLNMNIVAIDRIMKHIDFNILNIMEDMSCKSGMMISPSLFREFMMPYYKELINYVKGKYPSVFGIWLDSDGDVTELIPLLLECGVEGLYPFEVQAGMDVVQIRKQYGEKLVIRGGIDKREIAKGREAIDKELERVLPTFVKTGGYVICLDHQAPPDISLEDYKYFLDKAREYI